MSFKDCFLNKCNTKFLKCYAITLCMYFKKYSLLKENLIALIKLNYENFYSSSRYK